MKRSAAVLRDARVPFLLGGGLASWARGGPPTEHDVDFLLRERDVVGPGWVGFDFAAAFGCPVKVVNDAAMQALGSYEGGKMLFLGLGTGLGSALIVDGASSRWSSPTCPYRKATFEDYVGVRGLERLGKKKWRQAVADVVARLRRPGAGLHRPRRRQRQEAEGTAPGRAWPATTPNAFVGGFRLWDGVRPSRRLRRPRTPTAERTSRP